MSPSFACLRKERRKMAKKFVQNDNALAIAYYRYSSHSQSDASIEQQRSAARNYAVRV